MDENTEGVWRIYEKHLLMNQIGECCSDDHPCDIAVLFDEIKRLNHEIVALNALMEGMALAGSER